jgi:hypothetical protein
MRSMVEGACQRADGPRKETEGVLRRAQPGAISAPSVSLRSPPPPQCGGGTVLVAHPNREFYCKVRDRLQERRRPAGMPAKWIKTWGRRSEDCYEPP